MKTRIRTAIWAVTLCACACAAARAATVSVEGPASATPGGTLNVSVVLQAEPGSVYALQGALRYDPATLTPLPDQEASAARDFFSGSAAPFPGESIPKDADLFRMNASQTGLLIFGYVKNPTNPAGSPSASVPATALSLTFNVAPDASGSTVLQLVPYTVNGQELPAVVAGGPDGAPIDAAPGAALTVSLGSTARPGDANGDGRVSMEDVLLLLQIAGGLSAPPAEGAGGADVWPAGAPDGRITLEDAQRVWRFVSGLESGLD